MYMCSCVLQYRINNKRLLGVLSQKLNSWQQQWYHMYLWFLASKFGVWLVVPMTEYSALTFVNTSHAFFKFRTILALFVWGVSLNFTAYRRSRDTGSDLDRASIQRTSVRQLMQPAICWLPVDVRIVIAMHVHIHIWRIKKSLLRPLVT